MMRPIVCVIGESEDPDAAALRRALDERAETVLVAVRSGGSAPHGSPAERVVEVADETELRHTAAAIAALEPLLRDLDPAAVVVGGDGDSALAAALTASKLGLMLVRLGAGLRAGDRHRPERINAAVLDHVCDLLLCGGASERDNLAREGLGEQVELFEGIADDPGPAAEAVLARVGQDGRPAGR